MPTLLDIRRRIRSVKNTQQITRAMKMVAAARLRRAQDRVFNARPYANQMLALLGSLAARTEQRGHPLLAERPVEKVLLVLVTGDKGLCGAFNTNLIRAAQNYLTEHRDHKVSMMAVGRKGRDFYRKRQVEIIADNHLVKITCPGQVIGLMERYCSHFSSSSFCQENDSSIPGESGG